MSATAAWALLRFRQARITLAPLLAKCSAVALPMPVFPPEEHRLSQHRPDRRSRDTPAPQHQTFQQQVRTAGLNISVIPADVCGWEAPGVTRRRSRLNPEADVGTNPPPAGILVPVLRIPTCSAASSGYRLMEAELAACPPVTPASGAHL